MKRFNGAWALALGLFEVGCIAPQGEIGELPGGTDSSGSGTEGISASGLATGQAESSSDDGSSGTDGPAPSECGPDGPPCDEDEDGDCVGIGEDNAPGVYNPDQSDLDGDDIADPVDMCPSVVSLETADSDRDGLGNECDPCRQTVQQYNDEDAGIPGYMRVRNVPGVGDADGDGIGDACDNCVVVPNCEGYGPGNEWAPGDPIAFDDEALCQLDTDGDMVGDACQGLTLPGSAGPVGLFGADDFDQDGVRNMDDACPRAPLADAIACTGDGDCPAGRRCELSAGLCDHLDTDADGVGDACDTCPLVENPGQAAGGDQTDDDDEDGDFIGNACETSPDCSLHRSPARVGFYTVAVEGWCCTVQYPGDGVIFDPDGLPLSLDCDEATGMCRRIPPTLAALPGLVALPAGCGDALADAGLTVETHAPLTPADVGGIEGLWQHSCRLPPLDQDFDGLSDGCDMCRFAFDPANTSYIDSNGQVWPNDGKFCNGEYGLQECGM